MSDPTHREMFDYLAAQAGGEENVRFDIEEAIYWFANHYHSGQWSNLYSALSTSEFTPSPISNGPSDPLFYDMLVAEYIKPFPTPAITNEEKLQRWLALHERDLAHNLNNDEAYEHDKLENDLVEAGLLDNSGPQTIQIHNS